MVSRSSFSRNWRSSSAAVAMEVLCGGRLFGYTIDDGGEDGIRCLAVGMGVKVENDAVAQDRRGDGLNIVDAQVMPSAHQGEHAPALHQRLSSARGAAVAY